MQPGITQPPPQVIHQQQADYITGALVAVILALASVITLLWKRSERRYQIELKAAAEREAAARADADARELAAREDGKAAVEREVKRTIDYAERIATHREEVRHALTAILDANKADNATARAETAALVRDMYERWATENRTRDAKGEDLIRSVLAVVDAGHRRIGRKT